MGANQPSSPSSNQPSSLSTNTSSPKKESWANSFFSKIGDQLEDLTYCEIITATATNPASRIKTSAENVLDELNPPGFAILARTKIELDGDILMILPTDPSSGGAKIDKDIMDIHKQNTTVAVENWKNFLNMVIGVVNNIVELTGMDKKDVLEKFSISAPT